MSTAAAARLYRLAGLYGGVLLLVVAFGLRLALAWFHEGNYDQESYEVVRQIVARHGNVYLETSRYNYSPLWYEVLGALGWLADITRLPYHFVVRGALTLVDAGTAGVLVAIAVRLGQPPWRAALLFAANPVSILITGFHGQFDNLAVLCLLYAVWWQTAVRSQSPRRRLGAWGFVALAVLVKQIVLFAPLYALTRAFQDWKERTLAWFAACGVFFLSFVPFLPTAWPAIRDHVLLYSSGTHYYGLIALPGAETAIYTLRGEPIAVGKALLFAGFLLAAWATRATPPARALLVCMLVFLVLTPGFACQYVVLPIAFGALAPSWPFFAYSVAAGLYLLGNDNNLHWRPLVDPIDAHLLQLTWAIAVVWLVSELLATRRSAAKP